MTTPLAARLRTARVAADLTIAELAERSGVSVRSIGDIERGVTTSPQRATVAAISTALQLSGTDGDLLLSLVISPRRAHPPTTATGRPVDATPRQIVGRENERARLHAILQSGGFPNSVIVFGAAGVGKSALVADAARAFGQSPAVFVHFTPGEAPPTPIGAMLRLLESSSISGWQDTTNFEQAVRAWRSGDVPRHPVVILDALADEAIVRMFLSVGGFSTLVVTSRPPLAGISGVERLHVPPLPAAEAAQMLQERVPSLRPDECEEVAGLCDFLPLALDLIASRLETGSRDSARRLLRGLRTRDRRLDVLKFGGRSVRETLRISYDTLKREQARTFALLSVGTPPSFTIADAVALVDVDPRAAESDLDALADAGMLETLPGGRFRMPELVQLFGESMLARTS